jgi:hypothetical protein
MNRHLLVLASLLLSLPPITSAPQVVVATTPESFDEAIRLAADEKAARNFLSSYIVQTRAGWGNGPLIGSFSTPFARVVQAALAARKRGESFTTTNVTPDLIVPELHVIATSQLSATDDAMMASVQSVILAPHGSKNAADVVQPLKTMELTEDYQNLNGTTFEGSGVVAIFPLSALTPNSEIRVVFDRIARGSSALSTCRECVVPLNISRIR